MEQEKKKKKTEEVPPAQKNKAVIGKDMGFAAREAYKLLRANLMFALAESERRCKVIAVTSAVRGEGKTTTSVNTAYTLAETGKRVVIIDGDLRLPNVARMLSMARSPGLSNVLTGASDGQITVQKTTLSDTLFVVTSGDIPPNPSELLGTKAMERVVNKLAESFDYIVIDLPPVTVVSDALVIAPLCDGMLLVTRQDYSGRAEISKAVELLQYGKVKILGFVLNDSTANEKVYRGSGYKSRYYNRRYGHRYGHRYGYRYGYKYGYKSGYKYGYNKYGESYEKADQANRQNAETSEETAAK